MNGCPLWAYPGFDDEEDDYSEKSDSEVYFDDEYELFPEYDEWGREIEDVGGFQYIDIDNTIHSERMFDKHISRLFYTNKNIPKEIKIANSQRIKNERELQKQRTKEIHDRLVANILAGNMERSQAKKS
jgi:hypothetical protein